MKILKDKILYANIIKRLERLSFGNFGDSKYIGDSLYELRIHYGSGHRIYYTKHESEVIILLCAGEKDHQKRDIELAKKLAKEVKNETDQN